MKTRTNNDQPQTIPDVEASTNRYIGYNYNAIGAVTSDGSYAFSYDAFGQPLSKIYNNESNKLEYYVYTPGDERIGVQRNGWWVWSVRDEGGKVLRQYKSSVTNPSSPSLWLEDFVWRDGLLLGSQRPEEMGGRRHFHLDHLGTPRLITADNSQRISSHDYYPFGDEKTTVWQEGDAGFDREEPMKFTGHERDFAGGMGGEDGHAVDDMHARYYNPSGARFLSVDPVIDLKKAVTDPQEWNRYVYVLNNPIGRIDPDGRADKVPQLDNVHLELTDPNDHLGFGDGLFGSSRIVNVKKIDKIMMDTLSRMNDLAITYMMIFTPGLEEGAIGRTTLAEAKILIRAWARDPVEGTISASLKYHFGEHGAEVGAKNMLQYLRKAYDFSKNLKGAGKAILDDGKIRYMKNGRYLILDSEGRFVSFGLIK